MDNNLLTNNPLTPYLQPTLQNEEGTIFTVADFDEARKKNTPKNSKRVFFNNDLSLVFAKLTDENGKVTMATYRLEEVPNPVPITETELSGKIGELENSFNSRFKNIEDRLDKLMACFMTERGANNGAS